MLYSVSNIAWTAEQDQEVYEIMRSHDFSGLEIAPTRIFLKDPYDCTEQAVIWSAGIKARYGFSISSMQSIWYGRTERIFGSAEERRILLDYTKKAIDFAGAIGCRNLVFGCPRNRSFHEGENLSVAIPFFKEIGDYAHEKGTAIGFEANPGIYNTNYITDTRSALQLIRQVKSKGFLLNLDTGTMIYNHEPVSVLSGYEEYINHVHISEPGLVPLERRALHRDLAGYLHSAGYQKYISIEMSRQDNINIPEKMMGYVREVFG